MMRKLIIGAAALAICAPAGAAFAQDYGYGNYGDDWQHAQDHREHGDFHEDIGEAHARAHAEGFHSPEEHAEWHENADRAHRDFHEDHPGTWHDHYGYSGYYGGGDGGYYPYRNYHHRHYGYHRPSVSVYWGY